MGELAQATALPVRPRASSAKPPYMSYLQRCALGPRAPTFKLLVVPVAIRKCFFWAVGADLILGSRSEPPPTARHKPRI